MRIAVCLLLSVAVGCATYTVGAIVWACADPQGAGRALLFTIPVGFAATAVPGLLGLVGLVFRCEWASPKSGRRHTGSPKKAAAGRPTRHSAQPVELPDDDFVLAT